MYTVNKIAENDFEVLDEKGQSEGHWTSESGAQFYANSMNADVTEWFEQNEAYETGTQAPETQAEPAEEIGLDGQYEVGQEIEVDSVPYIVEKAFHIDAETSNFLDDMGDVQITPGWHANARRKR